MSDTPNIARPSRRRFLAASAATLSAAGLALTPSRGTAQDAAPRCLDYGRSFICHTSPKNSVRFWVESKTTVIDDENGTATEFYQCGSCKSENTFAKEDLFQQDNYDFLPILGGPDLDDILVFRRRARLTDTYRTVAKCEGYWGKPILKLRYGKSVQVLNTWEKIAAATAEAIPIVSRTEIANPDTKLRAIIECPVKTMNIRPEDKMYQVDTGPIAYPNLSERRDPLIDLLSLAFIAFNAPDFADFVVEQPTPVTEGEEEECKIYHYSKPFSTPAKNVLLAVD